ncbi:hypothetical protein HJ581_0041285 [Rhodococcus opacus]|nr:hypothetical protein [Rhodococcus opacus]WKN60218.1 hypothetical protein HJ581_0041285 [Rhodococcus opacus]
MKLPLIPTERQGVDILAVAAAEPPRNRLMLALAYDAALRREELARCAPTTWIQLVECYECGRRRRRTGSSE